MMNDAGHGFMMNDMRDGLVMHGVADGFMVDRVRYRLMMHALIDRLPVMNVDSTCRRRCGWDRHRLCRRWNRRRHGRGGCCGRNRRRGRGWCCSRNRRRGRRGWCCSRNHRRGRRRNAWRWHSGRDSGSRRNFRKRRRDSLLGRCSRNRRIRCLRRKRRRRCGLFARCRGRRRCAPLARHLARRRCGLGRIPLPAGKHNYGQKRKQDENSRQDHCFAAVFRTFGRTSGTQKHHLRFLI